MKAFQPASPHFLKTFQEPIAAQISAHGGFLQILSGTNVVLSNATGIPPAHMLIIYYICVLAGIPLTALKAHLIDNLRLKSGKYRPWILGMGIPTVLLCLAIVFTPYHEMSKVAAYIFATVYSLGLNFVFYFFDWCTIIKYFYYVIF